LQTGKGFGKPGDLEKNKYLFVSDWRETVKENLVDPWYVTAVYNPPTEHWASGEISSGLPAHCYVLNFEKSGEKYYFPYYQDQVVKAKPTATSPAKSY
jgi:hypothetical protein